MERLLVVLLVLVVLGAVGAAVWLAMMPATSPTSAAAQPPFSPTNPIQLRGVDVAPMAISSNPVASSTVRDQALIGAGGASA